MPDLKTLIKILQCEDWHCKDCPYGYQYWDDSGDNGIWTCDEQRVHEETLFFLSIYQKLIEDAPVA